jgi:serine protease Do
MKRFFGLAVMLVLVLAACHQESSAPAGNDAANNSTAKADSQATPNAPVNFAPDQHSQISSGQVPMLEEINRENIRVINSAMPSIVRIMARHPVDPRLQTFGGGLFHFPFGNHNHGTQFEDMSYGSGVIISKDGYIVTNNHVVADAKDLEVEMPDKQTFPARLVAADEPTDVAVLKIAANDLSALPWGDSDKVQVGEQVFAIGNPFDLRDSVSKGIVSAKGRSRDNATDYEDYIQTDAAINPGNSGGALINIHGELIGMSAAIASMTGYNMGVGFAIPSNQVRGAVEGLLKNGRMVRGYLGVLRPENVDEGVFGQLGLRENQGALLAGVMPDSPADKAGLQAFDLITAIDGHRIGSFAELRLIVAQIPIGKNVKIDFIRDGKPQEKNLNVAEMPTQLQLSSNSGGGNNSDAQAPADAGNDRSSLPNVLSGLQVTDLTDQSRKAFKVEADVTTGVVVSSVKEGSVPEEKSLTQGDVLESASVNRGSSHQLATAKDFAELAQNLKADQGVVLLVRHGKRSAFIYLEPAK